MLNLKSFAEQHLTVFVYKAIHWGESTIVSYGGKHYQIKPHPSDPYDFLIYELPETPAREPKMKGALYD